MRYDSNVRISGCNVSMSLQFLYKNVAYSSDSAWGKNLIRKSVVRMQFTALECNIFNYIRSSADQHFLVRIKFLWEVDFDRHIFLLTRLLMEFNCKHCTHRWSISLGLDLFLNLTMRRQHANAALHYTCTHLKLWAFGRFQHSIVQRAAEQDDSRTDGQLVPYMTVTITFFK